MSFHRYGQSVLDVVLADVPGMEFMTRFTVTRHGLSMIPSWYSASANSGEGLVLQGIYNPGRTAV